MPRAEVIVEEKLLPRSVLRESNVGKQFPHFRFAGENSGDCWPARHPAQLPPTQPHATSYTRPTPLLQPQLQTPCAIQEHITGAQFLPSNWFQAQALASGKSNTLVQTTPAHGQHCTGGNCSNQRNSADFPHVPEPSTAETTGQQQHISHTPGLSLG